MSSATLLLAVCLGAPWGAEGSGADEHASVAAAEASIERAVAYLAADQKPDGSFGTPVPDCAFDWGFAPDSYYAWQVAAQALACMALAAAPETETSRASLDAALTWLCSSELASRGSDWDIDNVWSYLYGFVACVTLARDPRFTEGALAQALAERGTRFYRALERTQAVSGGWAYYDDPPFDRTPTWATSFCTAALIPSLSDALELGWGVSPKVLARAQRYVLLCAMPGGAFAYDLDPVPRIAGVEHINRIEGSLGRTQVCNLALLWPGSVTTTARDLSDARAGLAAFFEHHGYLDHVRTRPIPHEGFHANAGYFYFFAHYYAARVVSLLPEGERAAWHARLRPHLIKTQQESGRVSDFLDSSYMVTASTSYLILALAEGLPRSSAPALPAGDVPEPESPGPESPGPEEVR